MGSRSPSVSVVQPPPPQIIERPQPSTAETSRQLFESQLQYNPQLTQQAVGLQQQYAPQMQALQLELAGQYIPQYRQLVEQQFPQIPTLSNQVSQRLASPQFLNPEQQLAQDLIRNREQERFLRGIRTQANLGGTLYSGNRERQEREGLSELSSRYALQDIGLQQQQRQMTLQELLALAQVAGFPVQQVAAPSFTQGVTPSADALLAAMTQTNLNPIINPSVVGFGPSAAQRNASFLGPLAQAGGQIGAAAIAACHVAEVLYGKEDLRTQLARWYVAMHESVFLRAYRRWSVTWAHWLTRLPWLKRVVQPIWDAMVVAQLGER